MSLTDVAAALTKFAQAVVGGNRDALVLERDALLAAPPPAPPLALPEPMTCRCSDCARAVHEEHTTRLKHAAWAGRVKALEVQLFALTFGNERDRDAAGEALGDLQGELMQAIDVNRARPWERVIVTDLVGRPREAYETATTLAEINRQLVALYHPARDVLPYLGSDELLKAIDDTRARMKVALELPLRQPLPIDAAKRAGTEPARRASDADRAGLRPGPDPSVLSGTVRFPRRD